MNSSPAAEREDDDLTQAIASAWQRHAQRVKYQWPGGCGGYIALQTPEVMAEMGFQQAVREVVRPVQEQVASIALHEVASAYAHRLAVMLECALLDRAGTWKDGHALLEEYRAALREAGFEQGPPTFMGEPVVMPNEKRLSAAMHGCGSGRIWLGVR